MKFNNICFEFFLEVWRKEGLGVILGSENNGMLIIMMVIFWFFYFGFLIVREVEFFV